MAYASIRIAQQDVGIQYIDSPRSKRLSVKYCTKNHCIIVRLPLKATKAQAIELITANRKYFEKFISSRQKLTHGHTISILGQQYLICCEASFRNYYEIKNQSIIIYHSTDINLNNIVKHVAKGILEQYLYIQVPIYANKISETFNRIVVKDISSRWGSCSTQRNLNFALNLAFVPITCVDYVIAHEVCHLKHMNHSQQFWELVKKLCPNYQQHRQQLKQLVLNL